jgi:hypothetical protein
MAPNEWHHHRSSTTQSPASETQWQVCMHDFCMNAQRLRGAAAMMPACTNHNLKPYNVPRWQRDPAACLTPDQSACHTAARTGSVAGWYSRDYQAKVAAGGCGMHAEHWQGGSQAAVQAMHAMDCPVDANCAKQRGTPSGRLQLNYSIKTLPLPLPSWVSRQQQSQWLVTQLARLSDIVLCSDLRSPALPVCACWPFPGPRLTLKDWWALGPRSQG